MGTTLPYTKSVSFYIDLFRGDPCHASHGDERKFRQTMSDLLQPGIANSDIVHLQDDGTDTASTLQREKMAGRSFVVEEHTPYFTSFLA
jgi:hypothetical protein